MDCLFCKIVSGEIPANTVYEDDIMLAFYDIDPKAPVHVLVIPKTHMKSLSDMTAQDAEIAGKILSKIPEIAQKLNITNGYRVVVNTGDDGGQTVGHLHFHILAGRQLLWPPG